MQMRTWAVALAYYLILPGFHHPNIWEDQQLQNLQPFIQPAQSLSNIFQLWLRLTYCNVLRGGLGEGLSKDSDQNIVWFGKS